MNTPDWKLVAPSKNKRNNNMKVRFDTKTTCLSEKCAKYVNETQVMSFLSECSDGKSILVKCKWCNEVHKIPKTTFNKSS